MEDIITQIDVDFTEKNALLEVNAKQCDNKSRFIKATLMNRKQKIAVPQEAQAYLNVEKADGKHSRVAATVNEDGTVTAELTYQMLSAGGIAYCDISVEDSEGEKLTTQMFKLNVERTAFSEEDILSMDEFDVLTKLILNVEKIETAYNDNEEARAKNEAARISNEEKREEKSAQMSQMLEEGRKILDEIKENGIPTEKIVDLIYPVGSIYISVSSINPQTLFGGTWVQFAKGQTLVGIDVSQTEFNAVEKTGGEKTHKLIVSEMPEHNHDLSGRNSSLDSPGSGFHPPLVKDKQYTVSALTTNSGGNQPHNNLQPYITTYMWKRTA